MEPIRFADGAKHITIEECLDTCKKGMAVYFEDGKDVYFVKEA